MRIPQPELTPMSNASGDAHNGQQEPSFPNHDTVAMSLRYPMMTVHLPTERCAIQEPHESKDCGEFAASGDDELKEALEELCQCVGQFESVSFDWACEEAETYQMENAQKAINAARQRVESLFGRIKEERDRLIEERRLDAGWMYAHELEGENASLQAELGRIREASLTPEEAQALYDTIEFKVFNWKVLGKATDKLSRQISGPPDKKEQ